jgi:amidohydrolase
MFPPELQAEDGGHYEYFRNFSGERGGPRFDTIKNRDFFEGWVSSMEWIRQGVDERFSGMVRLRRWLHRHPELSFHEFETARLVADELEKRGIEVRRGVGGNGVVGVIRGGQPGPTVALRADMDALPIQDGKTCEYRSSVPNVMHACGHDAHTSVLLAVADLLQQHRDRLKGNVRLLFQHAEEQTPGGALAMIEDGALDGADVIYGVHLWTPLPAGTVASRPGPFMAAADEFSIRIKGRGGHGGLPHESVDSLFVGAQLTVNLQSIISRHIDPVEAGVLTVGTFHAGSGFNVIAEQAELTGTVRSFSEPVRRTISGKLKEMAESTARLHGAEAAVEFKWGYPVLVNDPRETARSLQTAERLFGPERVREIPPVMAGEDFAYYVQRIPGTFLFVGAGNADKGIVHPHHHPQFDIDEEAMRVSALLLASLAVQYLEQRA